MMIATDYRRHASLRALTDVELEAFAALDPRGAFAPFSALAPQVRRDALYAALVSLSDRGMAVLVRGQGWARTPGYVHMDLGQHYAAGRFWTECECGAAWAGGDPDDADYWQADHRETEAERLAAER